MKIKEKLSFLFSKKTDLKLVQKETRVIKRSLVGRLFYGLLGCVLLYFGTEMMVARIKLRSEGHTVIATIVASPNHQHRKDEFVPRIEYQVNNKSYQYDLPSCKPDSCPKVGEKIEIVYSNANPSNPIINRFLDFWLWPLTLIASAFFCAFIMITGKKESVSSEIWEKKD
jgi:hypothetical protein